MDAIKEGIAVIIVLRPRFTKEPIVGMLTLLTAKPLQALEEGLKIKNSALFMQAYDSLTEGCSVCHSKHD